MTIGRFSRLTGLTRQGAAPLRRARAAAARPRSTPETGYRSYSRGAGRPRGGDPHAATARAAARRRSRRCSRPTIRRRCARVLVEHQRRTASRSAELETSILQGLQPLIDGKEPVMGMQAETLDAEAHRRLGVDLFNKTWTLMEKTDRTARGRRDDPLRARVRVSLAAGRHAGEPRAQRVAVLARARDPRPRRAGAAARAPLPRARRGEPRGRWRTGTSPRRTRRSRGRTWSRATSDPPLLPSSAGPRRRRSPTRTTARLEADFATISPEHDRAGASAANG